MVSLLAECYVHQGEPVGDFKVRVTVDRITAFGVEASHIGVHLHLVHDVDVGLSSKPASGNLVQREVLVVAQIFVKLRHRPVDAAKLQELPQLAVIDRHSVVGSLVVEVELRPHNDVISHPDKWRLDLRHRLLVLHGLVRNVVDERNALRAHRDAVHREAHEITDSSTDAAVEDEDVFGHLQLRRYFRVHDCFEFGLAQEEGLVLLQPHHCLEALVRDLAEGRFEDLVCVLQLIEEGSQALHLVDYGVVGDALCGVALAPVLDIELRVLWNV